MKAETKIKWKMIVSLIGMLCSVVVLTVSFAYAWFSSNRNVSASNMSVSVSDPNKMFFENFQAIRYNLDNTRLENHYKIEKDTLVLDRSIYYDENNIPTTNKIEKTDFLFNEMLPGEYVQITINYYLASSLDGKEYNLSLNDFSKSGTFDLNVESGANQGIYTYYVLGAFKYKPISLVYYDDDNRNNEVENQVFTDNYKWLDTYVEFQNDTLPSAITFDTFTWNSTYKKASFTFEIKEDFSQFFELISKSGVYFSNLLSEKSLIIGNIRLTSNN